VTEVALNAVEKRLNVALPPEYRTFLCTFNGGVPVPDKFMVPDRGAVMLGVLFGVGTERKALDLEYEQEQATMWDPLPPGHIAVGEDPGGSLLLLSTLGKDAGRVWFWDRVGFWVREDGQNTFPVAASFAEFVESLTE
jgi:hypothetical protein